MATKSAKNEVNPGADAQSEQPKWTFEERLAQVELLANQLEKELGDARQRLTMIQKGADGPIEVKAQEVERGVEVDPEDLPF